MRGEVVQHAHLARFGPAWWLRHRYPDRAGTAGPPGRHHDHDPHPRANHGGLGVKSSADLLGERGVGLPNEAAAGSVEAEWAADRGNVPSVQY